jgi:NAD-dependent deacetylase
MNTDDLFCRAADLIRCARHLVVLTGAGISTPSGIPDFRSLKSGLWGKVNPFSVASLPVFRMRPQAFFDWIRPLVRTFLDAIPNPAHLALAQLEQVGRLKAIITQNVDALHQKAGSENVIEVHGHIRKATCVRCYDIVPIDTIVPRFVEGNEVPRCEKCGGVLKPNVILLGEQLPYQEINAARRETSDCDLMLVVGSSLTVAPAAELPRVARENGAQIIVVNKQPTPIDKIATLVIRADVVVALPHIVSLVLGSKSKSRDCSPS